VEDFPLTAFEIDCTGCGHQAQAIRKSRKKQRGVREVSV
jgi:hypothetical protein